MIDWAIEAWNDYSKNLRECLTNEETIKTIKNVDYGEYIAGIGYQYDEYTKLAELVINHVLNKRLAYQQRCIGINYLKRLETGNYSGEIHLIMPLYDGLEYNDQTVVSEYYYTTVVYGSCSACDAMQYALSSDGDERTDALMLIALTMVQDMKSL